ncbi:hypothetical protein ACET3Z_001963 [Daucus carota]
MGGKKHNYNAWEERTISEVNVEYHLRSCSGNSLLAAVGNENRKGQMTYVVAKEYLEAFGSNATINAYTRWRNRDDVVQWLISLVRNDDSPPAISEYDLVPKNNGHGSSIDEEEKPAQGNPIKSFPKKLRSSLVHQKHDTGRSNAINLVPPKEATASEPTGIQAREPKPHQPPSFQVGGKIEILCEDSGMRGCWLMCKIVKVSKNNFKVQYNDADDVERSGKLEEWVSASRLAAPNRLSLRRSGRPIIRPCPPKEPSSQFFEVGAAVEVWWNKGWWESFVLTGVTLSSNNDSYHVFLPGEKRFLTVHIKDMRIAKDWIGKKWVAVKPQPDVLSVIWSSFNQTEE